MINIVLEQFLSEFMAQLPYYILLGLFFYKERKEGEKIMNTGKMVVDELREESTADKSLSYKIMAEIRELTKDLLYPGREAPETPPPAAEADTELTRKYSDVSNKYNEILEVTTASHQAIGTMMAELSEFKEYMKFRLSRLEYYNLSDEERNEFSNLDFDNVTGVGNKDSDDGDKNMPKTPSKKVSDILKNNKEN